MFFFLSKTLAFFLLPFNWIILLLLLSFLLKARKTRKYLRAGGLILFLFFSNSYLANKVMCVLEYEPKDILLSKKGYDYAIILGGMTEPNTYGGSLEFTNGADRLMSGLLLYKQGRVGKLIVTGGSGSITNREYSEADSLKKYLSLLNVDVNDVLVESESKNTHENALFTSEKYFNEDKTYVLITSAFHMRRGLACFEKVGMRIDPLPVDYLSKKRMGPKECFIPDIGAFEMWNLVLKEVVGYGVYYLMDYV